MLRQQYITTATVSRKLSTPNSRLLPLAALGVMLCSPLLQTGCSSTPPVKRVSLAPKYKPNNQATLDMSSINELEALLEATDMKPVENDRFAILRYGDVWERIRSNMKLDLQENNYRVMAQESWFASRQTYIDRLSARASRYLYYTVSEAQRRGIPVELALLPVIESSYDPAATSNAAAAGMWQFIPSTGKLYGLQQNFYYDGRRDVVESTRAAYDFLTSLYNRFGSWELALASYNAGPGRIQQAINRNLAQGLPTDFWSLKLPTETMNYVPRLFAVAHIVKQPDAFGVTFPKIANRPHFRNVELPGPVDLNSIAEITGLSGQELYELNPGYRRGQTNPNGPHRILIPDALSAKIDKKLKNMPTIGLSYDGGGMLATTYNNSKAFSAEEAAAMLGEPSSTTSNTLYNPLKITTPDSTAARNNGLPTTSEGLAALATKSALPTAATTVAKISTTPAETIAPRINIQTQPSATPLLTPNTAEKNLVISKNIPQMMPSKTQPPTSTDSNITSPATRTETPSLSQALTIVKPNSGNNKPVEAPAKNVAEPLTTSVEVPSSTESSKLVNKGEDPFSGNVSLAVLETQQTVLDDKGENLQMSYEKPYQAKATASSKTTPVVKAATELKTNNNKKGARTLHTIKAGETLSKIANDYGVNLADLAEWNQMDTDAKLWVGSSLYIYGATKKPAEAKKPTKYIVKSGDSLTGVASELGLSVQELAQRNNLKVTSNLFSGQVLRLVEDSSTNKEAISVKTLTYKLKKGDSLASVAKKQGISLNELAKLNEIPTTYKVRIGDDLVIPNKVSSNISDKAEKQNTATKTYILKKGDTLQTVAKRYHMTTSALATLNDVPPDTKVHVGDEILVPKK